MITMCHRWRGIWRGWRRRAVWSLWSWSSSADIDLWSTTGRRHLWWPSCSIAGQIWRCVPYPIDPQVGVQLLILRTLAASLGTDNISRHDYANFAVTCFTIGFCSTTCHLPCHMYHATCAFLHQAISPDGCAQSASQKRSRKGLYEERCRHSMGPISQSRVQLFVLYLRDSG